MINDSNIAVDVNACLACGRCVDRCIMDNLRLSLPPCRQGCPLDINCQGVLRLAALGRDEEAARELRRFTPFGGLLAHACAAPCETACSRKRLGDEALDIRGVARSLAARFADIVHAPAPCPPASGETAAVIGAGPAGLQAAYDMRAAGHEVTVFATAAPLAGLTDAVPAPLPERTLKTLTDMGVRIMAAGPHTPGAPDLDELCAAHDAVLDCAGLAQGAADAPDRVRNNVYAAEGGAATGRAKNLAAAMAEGRALAHTVNNILAGFEPDYESDRLRALGLTRFQGMDEERVAPAARVRPASGDFTPEETRREAERCLACGRPYEKNQTCWYCLPCEVVCPTRALHVRIPYLIR